MRRLRSEKILREKNISTLHGYRRISEWMGDSQVWGMARVGRGQSGTNNTDSFETIYCGAHQILMVRVLDPQRHEHGKGDCQ